MGHAILITLLLINQASGMHLKGTLKMRCTFKEISPVLQAAQKEHCMVKTAFHILLSLILVHLSDF